MGLVVGFARGQTDFFQFFSIQRGASSDFFLSICLELASRAAALAAAFSGFIHMPKHPIFSSAGWPVSRRALAFIPRAQDFHPR